MSKELERLEQVFSQALVFHAEPAEDGPGVGGGQYFEGEVHGLTVRICKVDDHVNGYVRLLDGHPWANKELFVDDWDIPAEVHGSITYRSGNWIGFDTAHGADYWPQFGPNALSAWKVEAYGDSLHYWTPEELLGEVVSLAEQAERAGRELTDGGHSHALDS